jgi:hypothetical protein
LMASFSGIFAATCITIFQIVLPAFFDRKYLKHSGRLRWHADGSLVKLPPPPEPARYHLFLSQCVHRPDVTLGAANSACGALKSRGCSVWGGGNQEKMRTVKEHLAVLTPTALIFLDVVRHMPCPCRGSLASFVRHSVSVFVCYVSGRSPLWQR